MSLRTKTVITITQQENSQFPGRFTGNGNNGKPLTFVLDFVTSGTINSSWQNLTDTATLKFPRNIYVEDAMGKRYDWTKNSIYGNTTGEASKSPLFIRGDRISIHLGYYIDNMNGTETLSMPPAPQFTGYITRIKNRIPIELECEDEMWKLKQITAPNKLFKGSTYNLKSMITELLAGTGYVVSDLGFSVNIGDFRTQSETVASVLERLRKEGGLYSYFRGKTLICSGVVYDPTYMATKEVFAFQENIISDTLEYTRKEDLNIAVKAYAQVLDAPGGTNADGTPKTKRKRLEVLVGKINANGDFGEISNPDTFHGDTITFPVIGGTTKAQLIDRARKYLPKLYYTGFRGSITTFGLPAVTHGNQGILRDRRIPERDGTYLIKQVATDFGLDIGIRQKITFHLRTDQGFTVSDLNAGVAG